MPVDVAVDGSGNVFVADHASRIQKFTSDGTFLTKWGSTGSGDRDFGAGGPTSIAVDADGKVFVADPVNSRIQKFTNTGTFLAKWGSPGSGDGQFHRGPHALAVDRNGNVFATDGANHRIQKFTNNGAFLTKWGGPGSGDGEFQIEWGGWGIAVDGNGNVFVADYGVNGVNNDRIEEFTNNGTFLRKWGSTGSGNGQFNHALRVAVHVNGNVFVADSYSVGGNNRIQEFTNTGMFIRKFGCFGIGEGQFKLEDPGGLTVDRSGHVYVADTSNNRIQKFSCP